MKPRRLACDIPAVVGYTGVSEEASGASFSTTRTLGWTISAPKKPGPHLAEEAQPPARRHLLHLARVEVEEAHPEFRLAVGQLHHQRAARAVLDLGLGHLRLDQHRLARAGLGERRELRLVLVAQRQVQHQVEAGVDAEFRELRANRGAGDQVIA